MLLHVFHFMAVNMHYPAASDTDTVHACLIMTVFCAGILIACRNIVTDRIPGYRAFCHKFVQISVNGCQSYGKTLTGQIFMDIRSRQVVMTA